MITEESGLHAETAGTERLDVWDYALARLISQIFHPMVLSVVSLCIAVAFAAIDTWEQRIGWFFLCMVMQIVPAILFFVIRLRQGAYSDEDVSVRHERNELYLVSLVTITLGTLMLLFLNAPIALIALHVGVWVISLLCWIINVFWKISVHATTASSTATIAFFLSPVLGLILGIGAVLVGWSRVRTGNHTPLQVLAGLVLAIVGISATFAVFGLI